MEILVSKQGGDYSTITEAINSIDKKFMEPIIIRIKAGIYEEAITIPFSNLSLVGEGAGTTIIRYHSFAKEVKQDGTRRGTFQTAVVRTDGDNVILKNIRIENTAGNGSDIGQAIALYSEGDQLYVEACHIIGHQDTLFTAPLPPFNKHGENKGFGPKQDAPRRRGRQIYRDCFIQGDVDFIFGGAMALFRNCIIYSKNSLVEESNVDEMIKGYIAAPCTPENQEYGYLFHECEFVSDCPSESVYLGRPWREYARSAVIDCRLDAHVKPLGYHDWGNSDAQENSFFAEGKNTGEGSKGIRPDWVHRLTDEESDNYIKGFYEVLGQ